MPRRKSVHGTSVHQTHEAQSRAQSVVHETEDTPWIRGASLDMPPARPGMDQRWIRTESGGKADPVNWSRKQREGWRPRPADTVAEDFPVPRIEHGRFAGSIGVEGMILCERSMALSERRAKHVRDQIDMRTKAINHDLTNFNVANANPAYGPIQMATKAQRVRARTVPVQAETDPDAL